MAKSAKPLPLPLRVDIVVDEYIHNLRRREVREKSIQNYRKILILALSLIPVLSLVVLVLQGIGLFLPFRSGWLLFQIIILAIPLAI